MVRGGGWGGGVTYPEKMTSLFFKVRREEEKEENLRPAGIFGRLRHSCEEQRFCPMFDWDSFALHQIEYFYSMMMGLARNYVSM